MDISDSSIVSEFASNPRELRAETEETVGYCDGEVGGHVQIDQDINIDAAAIGLGLENVEYEPEVFAGLIYRLTQSDRTVILLADGQLTVVDAPNEESARTALQGTVKQLNKLGLIDVDVPSADEIQVSKAL